MPSEHFASVHDDVTAHTADHQERNRLWWERLPMTYVAWEADERGLESVAALRKANMDLLHCNPFLRDFFQRQSFHGLTVLEIGCGSGAATCLMAQMGASVTAIDITETAVATTRRNAELQGLAGVDVRRMDAEDMAFPDASFDFVFSWGVIHHSSQPDAILAQIARVLKPNGHGMVMVYNRASGRYFGKGLYWLFAKGRLLHGENLQTVQRHFTDGYYHKHYYPWKFKHLLSSLGLLTERITISHMSNKMLKFAPRFIDDWLKARVGWLLIAEFRKN